MKGLGALIVLLLLFGCEKDEQDHFPYLTAGGIPCSVSGTVIDAITRKPLPDIEIILDEEVPIWLDFSNPVLPATIKRTRTDQNGNYHLSFITKPYKEYTVSTVGKYSCVHKFLFKERWGNTVNIEALPNQAVQIKIINTKGVYKTEQFHGANLYHNGQLYNGLYFRQWGFDYSALSHPLKLSMSGDTAYSWTLAMKNVPHTLKLILRQDFEWKQLDLDFTASSADTGYYTFYY